MHVGSRPKTWSMLRRAVLALLSAVTLAHGAVSSAVAGGDDQSRTVVVLYADANDGRPGHLLADRAMRAAFLAGDHGAVEVHSEHLDVSRFADPGYQKDLAEFLRRKYAERKVEVVIAVLASGLDFALEHRRHAFPGVPIVYCAVDQREVSARKLPADVIGVPIKMDLAETLETALHLQPDIQRVYVITGKSKFDVQWQAEARRAFKPYETRLEFIHLAGLPMTDLLGRVAELPEKSMIYYVHLFQDGDGTILAPSDALKLVAAKANVPIYSHVETYVGRGAIGGRVFSFEQTGQDAAALGLRILAGEKAEHIGPQKTASNRYLFDARQLKRWGISAANLPAGSELHHEEASFWDVYRWHILGAVSLCVVEALLILGLLVQRASRWGAEKRLQQAFGTLRESQAALRDLTGKLILAQETERRRIARELHDDLSQSLAIVAVELEMLRQKPPETAAQAETSLAQLVGQVKQLSSTVHELSHQLHPAKLEQLGLVPALIGLCKELSQSHGLTIAVKHHEVPKTLGDEIALCLYRIAQESLQNVIKHGAARHAAVELDGDSDFIRLGIADDGKGFDPQAVSAAEGLGLVSMRERLRLVQGEIAIHAQPGAGTRIEVRVPLAPSASRNCLADAARARSMNEHDIQPAQGAVATSDLVTSDS